MVKFRIIILTMFIVLYCKPAITKDKEPKEPKDPIPFYGNSTTFALGTIISNNNLATFDIARTYGRTFSSGGAGLLTSHNVGMGIFSFSNFKTIDRINLFYQYDFSTVPQLIPFSLRMDFISPLNLT